MSARDAKTDLSSFVRRVLVVVLVIGLVWAAWLLRFVLLLAFASVLLAIIIRTAAGGLCKRTGLPEKIAYPAVVILILGVPLFAFWKFGSDIAAQAHLISQTLPQAIDQAHALLARAGLAEWTERSMGEAITGSRVFNSISGILLSMADALANFAIVVVGGIFLAARPRLYRKGLLKLLPPRSRETADTAMTEVQVAMGLWLRGRLLAMVLVGALTALGLWWIGIPSYLALGLLAGILEFIPFIGPIIAAVPAVLLALLQSPADALLVAGLFVLVQQLEGNLITPVIQQHAVDLPPALLIFAVLGFGTLFGIVGIILAAPLTVVLFLLVKRLYVIEVLNTPTPIPGADDQDS